MSIIEQLSNHDACNDAIEWIEANGITTLADAWDRCHQADWMLWLHTNNIIKIDDRTLRLFACRCVRETPIGDGRTVWDLLADDRSLNVVEVAERYANGDATYKELIAAEDAAWDAARAVAGATAWSTAEDAAGATARAAARVAAFHAAWATARAAARAAARNAAGDAAWSTAEDAARAAAGNAAGNAAGAFQAEILREMVANPFKEATT